MTRSSKFKGKRFLIVARCSSEKQEASIPDQIAICKSAGVALGAEFVDVHALDGVPATNFRNVDRMVADVIGRFRSKRDFDFVIMRDPTRLARSGSDHGGAVFHEFWKAGIPIHFVAGDVDGPYGAVIRMFQLEMGREQVNRSAMTVAGGLDSALKEGRRLCCNRRPFATALAILDASKAIKYAIRDLRDGGQIKVDPAGAVLERFGPNERFRKAKHQIPALVPGDPLDVETVGQIYRLHLLNDHGAARIASDLNSRGILSPNGRNWTAGTIQGILGNVAYSGIAIAYKWTASRFWRCSTNGPVEVELGPDDYDPETGKVFLTRRPPSDWHQDKYPYMVEFLPEDVRERARRMHEHALLAEYSPVKRRPRRDSARESEYLLSGLLHSVQGGLPMQGHQGGANGGYRYYRVNPRRARIDALPAASIRVPADHAESAVLAAIHQALLADPETEQSVFECLKARHAEGRKRQASRTELQSQLQDLRRVATQAYRDRESNPKSAQLVLADVEPQIRTLEQELELIAAVPELSEDTIREESRAVLRYLAGEVATLRLAEPGRLKQLLSAMVADLRVDLTTLEAEMVLALPEEATRAMGALGPWACQWLKRTHRGEAVIRTVRLQLARRRQLNAA